MVFSVTRPVVEVTELVATEPVATGRDATVYVVIVVANRFERVVANRFEFVDVTPDPLAVIPDPIAVVPTKKVVMAKSLTMKLPSPPKRMLLPHPKRAEKKPNANSFANFPFAKRMIK